MKKFILILIILCLLVSCIDGEGTNEIKNLTTIPVTTTIETTTLVTNNTTSTTKTLQTLETTTVATTIVTELPELSTVGTTTIKPITSIKPITLPPTTIIPPIVSSTSEDTPTTDSQYTVDFVTMYDGNWYTKLYACVPLENGNVLAVGEIFHESEITGWDKLAITYGVAVLFDKNGNLVKERVFEEYRSITGLIINSDNELIITCKTYGKDQKVLICKISSSLRDLTVLYTSQNYYYFPLGIYESSKNEYFIFYQDERETGTLVLYTYKFLNFYLEYFTGILPEDLIVLKATLAGIEKVDKDYNYNWIFIQEYYTPEYFFEEVLLEMDEDVYALTFSEQRYSKVTDIDLHTNIVKYSPEAEEALKAFAEKQPSYKEIFIEHEDFIITVPFEGEEYEINIDISDDFRRINYVYTEDGYTYYVIGSNTILSDERVPLATAFDYPVYRTNSFIVKFTLNLE